MKKSLIALAVAGSFAAPAFAATANVDVYGRMDVAIQDTNATGKDIAVVDQASRLGFKGSEDLGGGLKVVWQIESQLNATGSDGLNGGSSSCTSTSTSASTSSSTSSGVVIPVPPPGHINISTTTTTTTSTTTACAPTSGTLGGRNTFVGLAGGFGTALIGRHDTPYKLGTASLDIFSDSIGDYNGRASAGQLDMISATHDARVGDAIAYISPTWSGFHFAVAGVATNAAANLDAGDAFDALSATGVYMNGPLFASLSYQKVNALGVDDTATKLGLGYTFGDTKVGFVYENTDLATHDSAWLLNVAHNMGPITLKAQYGKVDAGATDPSKWDLGVDYALSKRTSTYFVYSSTDNDNAVKNVAGWNIGLRHNF